MAFQWKKLEMYFRWKIENTAGVSKGISSLGNPFLWLEKRYLSILVINAYLTFFKYIKQLQFSHCTAWSLRIIIRMEVIVYSFYFCQQNPQCTYALLINEDHSFFTAMKWIHKEKKYMSSFSSSLMFIVHSS